MPILAHPDAVFVGLDVHKDSISAGILNSGGDSADVEKIFNDEESFRRLIGRLGDDPSLVWACYEAGRTRLRRPTATVAAGLPDDRRDRRPGARQNRSPPLPPGAPTRRAARSSGQHTAHRTRRRHPVVARATGQPRMFWRGQVGDRLVIRAFSTWR
jgi:hypothetical protein